MDKKKIFQHALGDSATPLGRQYQKSRLLLHVHEEVCEYLTADSRSDSRFVELLAVVDFCRLLSVQEVFDAITTHDVDCYLVSQIIRDLVALTFDALWDQVYPERLHSWRTKGYTENVTRAEFNELSEQLCSLLVTYVHKSERLEVVVSRLGYCEIQ